MTATNTTQPTDAQIKKALKRVKLGSLDGERLENCPEGEVLIDGEAVGTWSPLAQDENVTGYSADYRVFGYTASIEEGPILEADEDEHRATIDVIRKGVRMARVYYHNHHIPHDAEHCATAKARLRREIVRALLIAETPAPAPRSPEDTDEAAMKILETSLGATIPGVAHSLDISDVEAGESLDRLCAAGRAKVRIRPTIGGNIGVFYPETYPEIESPEDTDEEESAEDTIEWKQAIQWTRHARRGYPAAESTCDRFTIHNPAGPEGYRVIDEDSRCATTSTPAASFSGSFADCQAWAEKVLRDERESAEDDLRTALEEDGHDVEDLTDDAALKAYAEAVNFEPKESAEDTSEVRAPAKEGDRVRSYDFTHRDDCYVEGLVSHLEGDEGYTRVVIVVDRIVWQGTGSPIIGGRTVTAPQNGTPTNLGGKTNGIEILSSADSEPQITAEDAEAYATLRAKIQEAYEADDDTEMLRVVREVLTLVRAYGFEGNGDQEEAFASARQGVA